MNRCLQVGAHRCLVGQIRSGKISRCDCFTNSVRRVGIIACDGGYVIGIRHGIFHCLASNQAVFFRKNTHSGAFLNGRPGNSCFPHFLRDQTLRYRQTGNISPNTKAKMLSVIQEANLWIFQKGSSSHTAAIIQTVQIGGPGIFNRSTHRNDARQLLSAGVAGHVDNLFFGISPNGFKSRGCSFGTVELH